MKRAICEIVKNSIKRGSAIVIESVSREYFPIRVGTYVLLRRELTLTQRCADSCSHTNGIRSLVSIRKARTSLPTARRTSETNHDMQSHRGTFLADAKTGQDLGNLRERIAGMHSAIAVQLTEDMVDQCSLRTMSLAGRPVNKSTHMSGRAASSCRSGSANCR